MIYQFSQKSKFENLLHELKAGVLGQTIAFAAGVADEFDSWVARRLFGWTNDARSYPREFSVGEPQSSTTHLNQILLSFEALSFYLHAIDRLSFRPNSEKLREAIFDPIAILLSETFTEMLKKRKISTANNTLDALQGLSLRYAQAASLLGREANDKNSALWFAARAIAEDAGYPDEVVAMLMANELGNGLVALDLANRIKTIEAVL
jgi:hypothetical protein